MKRILAAGPFTDEVSTVRQRRYRVVKPAGSGRGAGEGTTPPVTVFGWRDLTSIPTVQNAGFSSHSSLSINGTAYPDSLTTWPSGGQLSHVDYNLNRDCKRLKATLGVDDRSSVAGTSTLSVRTDGTDRYVGSFGLTQAAPVATDLTDFFRITLSAVTGNGGLGAIGTPQVLCSF